MEASSNMEPTRGIETTDNDVSVEVIHRRGLYDGESSEFFLSRQQHMGAEGIKIVVCEASTKRDSKGPMG